MHPTVHPQLRLIYEGPVAARALMGAVSSHVSALVSVEVGVLAKALWTQVTFVRLLPTMGPPVVDEVGAVCEGFAALGALEGPFPGVGALVILQLGASVESLGAF